jgi:hypothetical protein
MDSLLDYIRTYASTAILALFAAFLVETAWLVVLSRRMRKSSAKWNMLLDGVRGENLERLLQDHLRERMALETAVEGAVDRVAELETKMRRCKRHLGLVRYDAFEDVGGSQSFALSLYDDEGNGVVLSGLIGRSDCRVYCKPIKNGSSERHISQEEKEAIRNAD